MGKELLSTKSEKHLAHITPNLLEPHSTELKEDAHPFTHLSTGVTTKSSMKSMYLSIWSSGWNVPLQMENTCCCLAAVIAGVADSPAILDVAASSVASSVSDDSLA